MYLYCKFNANCITNTNNLTQLFNFDWKTVFEGKEVALGGEAAGVAGQGAVGTDDAVAGDEDGEGIGTDCVGYGADGGRMADAPGKFAVGRGPAVGYQQQLVPHRFLKLRACEHQRHVELAPFACKVFVKLCHGCLNHG